MAVLPLTDALRDEYGRLFDTCLIRSARMQAVEQLTGKLAANAARYRAVGASLGVPWFFVAVIHNMEAGQRFTAHLHNGDPLSARTKHVPAGRPKTGHPPFTWEASAIDALGMKGLGAGTDWSLSGMLYQLERYNGWGYRRHHPHVLSPYLWSFSNHYTSGKYVADGTWSETAVSRQCGAAVLLRRMAEQGIAVFPDQPGPGPKDPPLLVRYSRKKFSRPEETQRAIDLQRWLNTFPGIFVKEDGVPGDRTSNAFRKVTGSFLPGDPRE